ncbi:MAG: hypothetical protein QM775_30150 [Pirellulales bacterium]
MPESCNGGGLTTATYVFSGVPASNWAVGAIERRMRLRAEHDAAGVAIEPMHVGRRFAPLFMHELHEIHEVRVPSVGHRQQAGRFVEGDELLVFVNDRRQASDGHASVSDDDEKKEAQGRGVLGL